MTPSVSAAWRIGVVMFLGGIGGGLVFPILPILGVRLGISAALIGLILAANRITRLFTNPVTGQLVDRFGGKGPLTLGLLIETLSTALYSFALHQPDPGTWLLIGRALWGVGSSFLIVGGMAAALKISTEEDRGQVTSLVRMALSIGMPSGLVVGGVIAGLYSDNTAFLSAAVLTIGAACLSAFIVPGARRVASSGGEVREEADEGAPRPGPELVLNPDGVEVPAGKAGRGEPRDRWAVLRSMVSDRRILIVWIMNFLIFLTLRSALMSTVVLVVDKRHIALFGLGPEPTAGLVIAMMLVFSSAVTLAVGRLLDRIRLRSGVVIPSLGFLVLGFAMLAFAHSTAVLLVSVVPLGVAMGGTATPLLTLMGDLVPHKFQGRAVGYYQLFGDGGGSIGPVLGVWAGLHVGFTVTYVAIAILALAFSPLAVWLWRMERKGAEAPA